MSIGHDRAPCRYAPFGYRFELEAPPSAACELVHRLYGAFAAGPGPDPADAYALGERRSARGSLWDLSHGPTRLLRRRSLGTALRTLEIEVCRRTIARRQDLVALHCAAMAGSRGVCLIVGPSGAGKSTLSLALAAHGYSVGSDDVALYDPANGETRPLPRCFHFDTRTRHLLRYTNLRSRLPANAIEHAFVTPHDVSRLHPFPGEVRSVVFLSPARTAPPALMPVTKAEMAVLLLTQSAWGARPAGEMLGVFAAFLRRADTYRLTSASLPLTVQVLEPVLGDPLEAPSTPVLSRPEVDACAMAT